MESHARRSNRARIVPAKLRENLEVEADIDTDTTKKMPSALKERTNRLSVNEGYTGPKNVVTLPSSSASSSSLSSDGGTLDSPNDAVIQPITEVANQIITAPSNLDGYNRNRAEREALARTCDFNKPESIAECFPPRKGKGQCSCPPILLRAAETYDGKVAIISDWRGLSPDQQKVKYFKAYEDTAAEEVRTSNVARGSQQQTRKRKFTLVSAAEIDPNDLDFGDSDDPNHPFTKLIASRDKAIQRATKKRKKNKVTEPEVIEVRFSSVFFIHSFTPCYI